VNNPEDLYPERISASPPSPAWLRVSGRRIVAAGEDAAGEREVRLRGVGIGGWLNMENFITGYPGTEAVARSALRASMGAESCDAFFAAFTERFYAADDAAYLASLGVNCVRLPVNYHHLLDTGSGLALLEAAVNTSAAHGLYTILDLHALPGGQNQHWHSDNPTHVAAFWDIPVLQDQVARWWEAIAARFAGSPAVAGYNLINEPACPDGDVLAAYYARLAAVVRAADPRHILFLDGNKYGTDFGAFARLADDLDNVVFAAHDYALPGLVSPADQADGGAYPGTTRGEWFDAGVVRETFRRRTEFMTRTGTPVWIGEFGPLYTGDPAADAQRLELLRDQLEIYDASGAGWSLWTYKDLGLQGLVTVAPDSAYARRIAGVLAKKKRLGTDSWGGSDRHVRHVLAPLEELVAAEFPDFDPYPWGQGRWISRLIREILLAEPLVEEFAARFAGVSPAEAEALAESFAFENCDRNEEVGALVKRYASRLPGPAQDQRVAGGRQLDEAAPGPRRHGAEGRARPVAGDDAALGEEDLLRAQSALAVLVVDEGQQVFPRGDGGGPVARQVAADDPAQLAGDHRARHRPPGPGVQVGDQGDRLLAVERARQAVAEGADQRVNLVGGLRHLDLGVAHLGHLPDQVGQQARRQRRRRQGRVLHHDGDVDRAGHPREVLDHRGSGNAERHPEGGRHEHHHRRARVLRGAAARRGDARAVVAGRDDHRDASGDMLEQRAGDRVPLVVGQRELLGVVGEHAQPVDPGVDEVVDDTHGAVEVQALVVAEDRGHDRHHAGQRSVHGLVLQGRSLVSGPLWCQGHCASRCGSPYMAASSLVRGS
jgi:endoglucanase